jgi:hypothetical protein
MQRCREVGSRPHVPLAYAALTARRKKRGSSMIQVLASPDLAGHCFIRSAYLDAEERLRPQNRSIRS